MQNIKAQQKLKEENSNIKASKNRVIKKSTSSTKQASSSLVPPISGRPSSDIQSTCISVNEYLVRQMVATNYDFFGGNTMSYEMLDIVL